MSKINDGGPAFPHMMAEGHRDYASGMTLRDWFAGQARVAMGDWTPPFGTVWILKNGAEVMAVRTDREYHEAVHKARAEYVWAEADAMLAAREAKP